MTSYKKCDYCKRKADVLVEGLYWCADCMIAKLGIWVDDYGNIQRKKTKQTIQNSKCE